MSESVAAPSDREIVLTRVFDAPRERVWEAWTDPEQLAKWWGPNGFTTTTHEIAIRPGGVWRHTMRGPDGVDYPNESRYEEVVRPERIVYSHGGATKGGPGANFRATVTFKDLGDERTELTLRMVFVTAAARDLVVREYGAIEGGKQHLGRLAELLARGLEGGEFVFTRVFDAPRERVFRAWTDPLELAKWWGPKGFTNSVCEADARAGGAIRIHMRGPDGAVYPMTGEFREVVPPVRLTFAAAVPGEDGKSIFEVQNVVTLDAIGGKTTCTLRARVIRKTPPADVYLGGMNEGWTQSLERLAEHLSMK
jgi:uncharacterized protein YndB with AHSA1/START domain